MKCACRSILGVLLLCRPGFAQITTYDVPINRVIVGGCITEPVALVGSIHAWGKRTEDKNGMIRIDSRESLQGEGTGLATGIKYQPSGKTTDRTFFSSAGIESVSWKYTFSLVGPGPDNNLVIYHLMKWDGDTLVVDDSKTECK